MPAHDKIQLALDEKVVEDADLERLLDVRTAAKDRLSQVQAEYRKADEAARTAIEKLDIGLDAAVRVGRYRITRTMTEGGVRSFEVAPKERTLIGMVKE